jgi:hypothetical protein
LAIKLLLDQSAPDPAALGWGQSKIRLPEVMHASL